jgi:TolA-binding protein
MASSLRNTILVLAAIVLLPQVLRAETQDAPDTLYREGMGHFTEGNYTAAAKRFQELLDRFGTEQDFREAMEQVYYALGCSYFNSAEFESCIETFEAYIKRYPEAKFVDEALFRIAEAHQVGEAYEEGVEAYRRLLSEHPDSPYAEDAGYQVGLTYMIQSEYEKAADTFATFCDAYPRSELWAQAAVFRARALFEQDQMEEALAVLSSLSDRTRTLDHITYANFLAMEIGDAAFDETDYELALMAYRRVQTREYLLRLQKSTMEGLKRDLANLRRRQASADTAAKLFRLERRLEGRLAQASELLNRLRDMPAYDAGLFHRIGRCFFNLERFWEARVGFRRVADEADDASLREAALFDLALVISRQRRFKDLIAVCDEYLGEFGEDEKLKERGRVPTIAFMRAESYVNQELFEQAESEMRALLDEYPDHPQRPRIEFYLALSLAMQSQFEESIERMRDWLETYPDHHLLPEVRYWLPVALFYDGQYEEALPLYRDYAARYPMTVYAPEAEYRAGLCMYSLEQFKEAALALGAWLKKHPDHYFKWEALVTRADALAAIGMLEEAKENYLEVNEEGGPFYYMALTQCAKVFKALGTDDDYQEMAEAFLGYIRARPDSGNVVDAAYQAGWALRQVDRPEEARQLYWGIIERYGNRRAWEGFKPLFNDLNELYRLTEGDFRADLDKAYRNALNDKKFTLGARLKMAMSEADVQAGEPTLRFAQELEEIFRVEDLGPEELLFAGNAYLQAGFPEQGLKYLLLIQTEFPQSRFLAEVKSLLAERAIEEGRFEQGFQLAEEAIYDAYEPDVLIRATYARARGLAGLGRHEEAIEAFKMVLANGASPREMKVEALLAIGRALFEQKLYEKSIAYFQRIYVLYGAYEDAVAEAYLRSGEAFEKLNDWQAALNTYGEMLQNEALAVRPEGAEARKRLERIQ